MISVIIPAFNREAYLAEAIESALRQTLPPGEIIVVDDGSTDRTGEIARSFGEKVRCITQDNQGVGAARNTGIKAAAGDKIALLDSDDVWMERKLEAQEAYLDAHPGVAMVFCRMKPFASPEIVDLPKFDGREIAACNAGALLARRETFERAGLFPTDRNLPEFLGWFTDAGDAGLSHYTVPELLLLRRVHLGNMVREKDFKLSYIHFVKQRLDQKRKPAAKAN
jgi:glycosyltransferase involved in cell wall biosynthesis